MSGNLRKYSFKDLLSLGKIRIPEIQRDYAQGRLGRKVNAIRKEFVHTLLLVVKGKRPVAELDFVYGSNQNNAFEPLDGQQRLTTLFLLHWMMGVAVNDGKHSLFTYETRSTSEEFCNELVQHPAKQYIDEALKKRAMNEEEDNDKKQKKPDTPSYFIKGRDWFKWEWKYDPTILSMLVMIDAIYEEMIPDWSMDLTVCQKNLENITFNLLNLGEFGLSNELFIKMNARGKQLSDFDKLKSTLEEELQIQQGETDEQGMPLASEKEEERWRSLMDGPWIDFFWHKYARAKIEDTENASEEERKKQRLYAAKLTELQFKKLLLRLVALQLFENNNCNEKLCVAAYNIDETEIDDLLMEYTDSLLTVRSDGQHSVLSSSQPTINFRQLIADVNSLIFQDDLGTYWEIPYLLPKISHIGNDNSTLLDSFLETNVANDVELVFYAMLLFLRAYPKPIDGDGQAEFLFRKDLHKEWLKNLECWVRSTRNILLNNNNNQRIDKMTYAKEATQGLKQMVEDFVSFVKEHALNVESDETTVKKFFAGTDKNYQRLDNQSLAEERIKAKYILEDATWESCIDEAERHPYLWGQIRSLLNWSEQKIDLFKEYSERLLRLLNFISDYENRKFYYAAMLVFAPDCWKDSNRLFVYNNDRDNSFKRYLREHTKQEYAYGANIKALLDLWKNEYSDKTVMEFLNDVIASETAKPEPWIKCIAQTPSIIDYAWNKRIYTDRGHVILAQRLTRDSHCYDPIFLYFRSLCQSKGISKDKCRLYDSKDTPPHAFELNGKSHSYRVEWGESDGLYTIEIDESDKQTVQSSGAVSFMKEAISKEVEEPTIYFEAEL